MGKKYCFLVLFISLCLGKNGHFMFYINLLSNCGTFIVNLVPLLVLNISRKDASVTINIVPIITPESRNSFLLCLLEQGSNTREQKATTTTKVKNFQYCPIKSRHQKQKHSICTILCKTVEKVALAKDHLDTTTTITQAKRSNKKKANLQNDLCLCYCYVPGFVHLTLRRSVSQFTTLHTIFTKIIMSKRASAKEKLESKSEPLLEEVYSPAQKEEKDCCGKPRNTSGKKPKKEPINWSAILLLLMFSIPAVFGAYFTVVDYMYPENAKIRSIRQPLEKCYNAANPEKVAEIDYIMDKYKGREQKLFAQLRTKYAQKYQECEIWPPH